MHLLLIIACYLAGAVALMSAGAMGWSMLSAPAEKMSAYSQPPKLVRRADRYALEDRPVEAPRPNGAFRYGPEINHGRADTPVNYAQQALKEAQSAAARSAWARAPSKSYRAPAYRERRIDMGTRPSGH